MLTLQALAAASSADVQGPSLDLISEEQQEQEQQQQQQQVYKQVHQQEQGQGEEDGYNNKDKHQPDQNQSSDQQQQQRQQQQRVKSPDKLQPATTAAAAATNSSSLKKGGGALAAAIPQVVVDVYQEQLLQSHSDPVRDLLEGKVRTVEYSGGQVVVDAPRSGRVYLPGSFNPLHVGHKQLLEAAVAAAGGEEVEGCFELSVGNADKVRDGILGCSRGGGGRVSGRGGGRGECVCAGGGGKGRVAGAEGRD